MALIPAERIERCILLIRGQKVMLDSDLAGLYGVLVGTFNQTVRRNLDRFPEDFMFQLSEEEFRDLRRHFSTARWGGRRYRPYAFTEQGAAMLSSILRSPQAIRVNIAIMRAFVKLRHILASHAELSRRLDELEKKYDKQFAVVFDAIRQLMEPPEEPPKGRIGFHREPQARGRANGKLRR